MLIHNSKIFPYSSVNHCVNCYEKIRGIQLKKFRSENRFIIANNTPDTITKKRKIKKEENFNRESSLESINSYLLKQFANSKPIKFYYRDDIAPREFSSFFIVDNKYIKVLGSKGYYITFLIDRIRKI